MPQSRTTMKFTVDQYHEMGRAGILRPEDRVELIDGEIVQMSPIGPQHAACVTRLDRLLQRLLGNRGTIRIQNPIVLHDHSEPQPDGAVLRYREDDYDLESPGARDVLLAIEVADTTYDDDSEVKIPAYARAGIREALLVDIERECVEVHRRPAKSGYRSVKRLVRGERFTLLAFPDVTLTVDGILGRR